MSARNHQLGKLETRTKHHGPNARHPLISAVGDAERYSVDKKYSGMLDLVRKKSDWSCTWRNQRKKDDHGQHEPSHNATDILRKHVMISRYSRLAIYQTATGARSRPFAQK